MILALKYLNTVLSNIGISEIGAAMHNVGQVIIAGIMIGNIKIITYLPFLLLLGLFTGYFVGLGTNFVVANLEKNFKYVFRE